MGIKLIENWRQGWRWFSTQAMVIAAALQGAWLVIPPDMLATIPAGVVQGVTIVLLVMGVAGRLVQQTPKEMP